MTSAWRFKAVARMDLGASDQQNIYMTSQKQGSQATNGTAVTASGQYSHAASCCIIEMCILPCGRLIPSLALGMDVPLLAHSL